MRRALHRFGPSKGAPIIETEPTTTDRLTGRTAWLLAAITGATVANAYYIHPIIADVARGFGVSPAAAGIVPAANQIALALGIFLLLPLGDRFSNRRLAIVFAACQAAALVAMALAESFVVFTAASTLLGFVTVVPYLMPAYASKRVAPERLGHVTALLTAGVIVAILLARTGAGVVAEHADWRWVYWIAAAIMAAATLLTVIVLEDREDTDEGEARSGYFALVGSTLRLMREHRVVLVSGTIQACNFGTFVAVWLGLAFYLTGPEMGYGTDTVGYLAAVSAASIFITPALGRWADRIGPYRARFYLALCQLGASLMLWPAGASIWLLLVPLLISNIVGAPIDVVGRMTLLSLAPDVRTRLMTGYIILMFIGGGLASWLAPAAYDVAHWPGIAAIAVALTAIIVLLSWIAWRREVSSAAAGWNTSRPD